MVCRYECGFRWESKAGETWDLGGREQQLRGEHNCIGKPGHDGNHQCCCGHTTGGDA